MKKGKKKRKKNRRVTEFGGQDKTEFIGQAYRRILLPRPWLLMDYNRAITKSIVQVSRTIDTTACKCSISL